MVRVHWQQEAQADIAHIIGAQYSSLAKLMLQAGIHLPGMRRRIVRSEEIAIVLEYFADKARIGGGSGSLYCGLKLVLQGDNISGNASDRFVTDLRCNI